MNVAASDRPMLVGGIRLFAWALPLWAFVEVATSAIRAKRVFGAEIRLRIFWEQVIRLALALGFWSAGFGITGLLYAHLASLTMTVLLSIRLLARYYHLPAMLHRGPKSGIFRETLFAGLATLPYNGAARLYNEAPPVIVNLMLPGAAGASAAALYTIARKSSSIIQMIRIAFAYVIAPLASAAAGEKDHKAIESIYGFSVRLSAALALPLTAAIVAGGPAILDLFGREAIAAWGALAILAVARAIEAMGGQAAQIQQVISRYHRPLYGSLTGLTLAVASGIMTVPIWGLSGAALAVGVGLISSALITIWQVDRHENMHPFDAAFWSVLLRTIAVAALVVLVTALAMLAPRFVRLPLLIPILLGGLWLSLKLALPPLDKAAFGKLGRRLRL
jgi:O-antigen/teichoic acid export membrane protein